MGWDQKDAVGESLREGDRVKVFRNFSGDEDCKPIVGHTGVVEGLEQGSYRGRLAVLVYTDGGRVIWVHHMSVMKV